MRVTKTNLPIHFMPGAGASRGKASCGDYAYEAGGSTLGSRDVRDVTCSRCMGTDEYQGGALAQRHIWEHEDNPDGFTVTEKLNLGTGLKAMNDLADELGRYVAVIEERNQMIADLEYALHSIPWWEMRKRRPIKAKLDKLRKDRGY